MSSDWEEVEIKIEYNESFERDPLSNKCLRNTLRFEADLSVFSLEKVELDSVENADCDCKNNHSLCGQETKSNGITWYKAVDEFGRYLCKFCKLSYSTVQTLRHHVKYKHPKDAEILKNIISNNKRNSKIKCHICKKRFKLLTDLEDHVKSEHDAGNLELSCHFCDAMFNNKQQMFEHILHKHNIPKSKLYSCKACGYRTLKLSHFKQHTNTHLIVKTNKCQYCDYATNYLPNLKIHERLHTKEKPYVCNFKGCIYSCSAKSALRSHQLKHNPEKNMLYCDKCNYKTVYKQSLKKHADSHMRNSIRTK
ncbi:uncharacterized protein ACR2FA_003014 [Aphomia sociella]